MTTGSRLGWADRSSSCTECEPEVLDVVGIGFGPSNLALAIALEEYNHAAPDCDQLRSAFFEKQLRFGWHRGMLIDDATMQVSYLKDLVTRRNPTSDFSFLSYLHQAGRLDDFINHKILFPLRIEFHDYLEWAARRVAHLVQYGCEVVDVKPVADAEAVTSFDVVVRTSKLPSSERFFHRTRNVVVAAGLEMHLPAEAKLSDRVWHNCDLLHQLDSLPGAPMPQRFVVVGAGQSAAEVVEYLHRRFPEAQVCSVFKRYGFTPADDSPFANRVFDPASVDTYYYAPRAVKRMIFDYHRNTNYSVVDEELISELYRRAYQERVQGRERLKIFNASHVVQSHERPDRVDVTVEHLPSGQRTILECDAVVYATGYRLADWVKLLGEAGQLCQRDDEGMVCMERDYRVATSRSTVGGIYLQGATEHSHGIGSSLLSNIAVRTGEIVRSIADHRDARRPRLVATSVAVNQD